MKRLILFELILLFLATTFMSDNPPGWFQQTLPVNDIINDIFFLDSLTGWVVTQGGSSDTAYIMKTTDGGSNWNIQFSQNVNLISVQFLDNNTGYASGGNGPSKLYKTTDGGNNWVNVATAILGFSVLHDMYFINKDTGWVCDNGPPGFGGLARTTDGGFNWQLKLDGSYRSNRIFFINRDTGWVASNEANGRLFNTTNGGMNWNLIHTFTAGPKDLFFVNKDTGWVTAGSTGIMKTIDAGFSWISQNNPGTITNESKLFFTNNKKGWAGVFSNRILATQDGLNWGYQTTPAFTNFSVYFTDSIKGWAGTSILIHTDDGGGPINKIKIISNEVPLAYKLYQNYPNPFNPVTKIKFNIRPKAISENAKIIIYDLTAKLVTILMNEELHAGTYEVDFDGSNYSSGIYFYILVADGKLIDTKKMILLK